MCIRCTKRSNTTPNNAQALVWQVRVRHMCYQARGAACVLGVRSVAAAPSTCASGAHAGARGMCVDLGACGAGLLCNAMLVSTTHLISGCLQASIRAARRGRHHVPLSSSLHLLLTHNPASIHPHANPHPTLAVHMRGTVGRQTATHRSFHTFSPAAATHLSTPSPRLYTHARSTLCGTARRPPPTPSTPRPTAGRSSCT